ncbi:hypothetical protein [uncultured Clostridium sp.]|uniref:hypothetical protein n=1 Tax=uncultured Clostridium sp. TaxID=59620 RepID=UPI00267340C7|nr:hypothetical protein [uncultured Clostridium sp.]
MSKVIKSRKELLEERIAKLESYIFCEDCGEILKNIYTEHLNYLRQELKEYEVK